MLLFSARPRILGCFTTISPTACSKISLKIRGKLWCTTFWFFVFWGYCSTGIQDTPNFHFWCLKLPFLGKNSFGGPLWWEGSPDRNGGWSRNGWGISQTNYWDIMQQSHGYWSKFCQSSTRFHSFRPVICKDTFIGIIYIYIHPYIYINHPMKCIWLSVRSVVSMAWKNVADIWLCPVIYRITLPVIV